MCYLCDEAKSPKFCLPVYMFISFYQSVSPSLPSVHYCSSTSPSSRHLIHTGMKPCHQPISPSSHCSTPSPWTHFQSYLPIVCESIFICSIQTIVIVFIYLLADNESLALSILSHPRCPDVNEKDGSGNIVVMQS